MTITSTQLSAYIFILHYICLLSNSNIPKNREEGSRRKVRLSRSNLHEISLFKSSQIKVFTILQGDNYRRWKTLFLYKFDVN